MPIEKFADEAVGFAKAKLPPLNDLQNPLIVLIDAIDPISYVIQAWGDQHPGIELPNNGEVGDAIIAALIRDCPSLRGKL